MNVPLFAFTKFRAKTSLSKTKHGGGSRPFSTIVFKNARTQNMENLSDTKIFYVTKGCLKNLARAKSALRTRNLKKSFLKQLILTFPQVPSHIMIKKNWIRRCLPNSLKSPQNFLFNSTNVVSTTIMCLKSLAGILPQKFLTKLSNSLNFGGCEGMHCTKLFHCKSRDKMLSNELY